MIALALGVASTPHSGQWTSTGMRPSSGSTSNLNRVPQSHWILISTAALSLRVIGEV
jgi:hypothetical protein